MQVAAEGSNDLLAFACAQQTRIDEDAGQLISNGAMHQQRRDRRIDAMLSSIMEPGVQPGSQAQMRKRKLRIISLPCGVCVTSGWNCSPTIPCALAIAATGLLSVQASTLKPSGSWSTLSPWLIQTGRRSGGGIAGPSRCSVCAGEMEMPSKMRNTC